MGDISLRRLVLDDHDNLKQYDREEVISIDVGREVDLLFYFQIYVNYCLSERLPYDVIHILNRYFENIGNIIDINGGYIDKYYG
jgi:hypothetical protein